MGQVASSVAIQDGSTSQRKVSVVPSTSDATKNALVVTTATGADPSFDEYSYLLRRIVKLLEASATVDIANRQKVTIDAMTAGMGAAFGIGVTLVGQGPTANAPTLQTLYPLPTWEGPVDQRWRVMEDAHQAYQLGIRAHLSFTS